ncbi:MAG: hypothetical protein K2N68_04665, partial [Clostridia bacterium]|nr:hypothetical protein [Clostridia bacterium]
MKKAIKAALISLVLTLSLAVGILFAACGGNGPVKFKAETTVMGTNFIYTLTLSDEDDTFKMDVTTDRQIEEGGTISQIMEGQKNSGTYKFENDVYTLTFTKPVLNSEGQATNTVVSTKEDGKYVLTLYSRGQETVAPLKL